MILLNQLIESVLSTRELLANCAFGKPKDCGMSPNLVIVRLELCGKPQVSGDLFEQS